MVVVGVWVADGWVVPGAGDFISSASITHSTASTSTSTMIRPM